MAELAKRSCGLLHVHPDLLMSLNQSFPKGWDVETDSNKGITLTASEEVFTSQDGVSRLTRAKS